MDCVRVAESEDVAVRVAVEVPVAEAAAESDGEAAALFDVDGVRKLDKLSVAGEGEGVSEDDSEIDELAVPEAVELRDCSEAEGV